MTDTTTNTVSENISAAESVNVDGEVGDGVVRDIDAAKALIAKAMGPSPEEVAEADAVAKAKAASKAESEPEQGVATPAPPKDLKSRAIAERAKKDAAFHKQKQEVEAKAKHFAELEALAAKVQAGEVDPDDLLKGLGVDYRRIVEAKLKVGKKEPTETEVMKQRLEALETQVREKEAALHQAQIDARRETAERTVLSNISAELEALGDKYDGIVAFGAHHDVLREMQRHLVETATEFDKDGRPVDGEVLTVQAAADIVEQRYADLAAKAARTKYARQLASATPAGTVGAKSATTHGARTLTNGHGPSGASQSRPTVDGTPVFNTTEEAREYMRGLLGS